jgi:hypothetical protein
VWEQDVLCRRGERREGGVTQQPGWQTHACGRPQLCSLRKECQDTTVPTPWSKADPPPHRHCVWLPTLWLTSFVEILLTLSSMLGQSVGWGGRKRPKEGGGIQ